MEVTKVLRIYENSKSHSGQVKIPWKSNIIVIKEKSSYPLLSESSWEALGLITYNKKFVTRQAKRLYHQLNQITTNMKSQGTRQKLK